MIYGEALPTRKQLATDFPNRPDFRRELANGHSNVGVLLRDKGLLKDAEAAHAEALPLEEARRRLPHGPRLPQRRRRHAVQPGERR